MSRVWAQSNSWSTLRWPVFPPTTPMATKTSIDSHARRPDGAGQLPEDAVSVTQETPQHSDPPRRARWPLVASFASSGVVQALGILTGLLLARILGPQGRGELAAVLLWPLLLATVGGLGVHEATTYHVARATAALGTLVGSSLVIAFAQSVLLIAVGVAIVPLVLSHYDADTVRSAHLFLACIPLNLIALSLMAVVNGRQRFYWFQALRLSVIIFMAVGLLGFALADALTVRTAVIAYLAANGVTTVAAGAVVFSAEAMQLRFSLALSQQLLWFGLRSHLSNVSLLLNERLDQLVISVFLAPAKLGLYVIAVTMTSLTSLVGSSVAVVVLPVVARLQPGPGRNAAVRNLVRLTLAGSVAITIPLLLLAPVLIDLFFGEAFHGAADVSRVLLVAAVILSTNRTLGAVLKGIGRPFDAGIAEAMALGTTLVGLAALLPAFGLMGAGIVSLLAYAVGGAWMIRQAARALEMPVFALLLPDREELGRLARLIWAQRAWPKTLARTAADDRKSLD